MIGLDALKMSLEWLETHKPKISEGSLPMLIHAQIITSIKEALALQEYDYKDLYEKEKRKSAMWLAKYEEVAGTAPKAIPMAQPDQEPVVCVEYIPCCTDQTCSKCKPEQPKQEFWECVCGANLYVDANGVPRSKASVEPATVMFTPE